MPLLVKDLLDFIDEQKVTERECDQCGKTFNPHDKGTYILVCSYDCAHKKFLGTSPSICNEESKQHARFNDIN